MTHNTNHWNEEISQTYEQFRAQGSSLITHIYPELRELGLFHQNMSSLSIGPGDGSLEVVLAQEYHAQINIVEPSAKLVANFQQKISDLHLQEFIAEICIDKFENFQSTRHYDLITAIHSWHYIGYEPTQLKKAIALLAPDGAFCIAQTSEQAFTKELKDLLHPNGHFFIDIEPLSRFCHEHGFDHQLITINKIIPMQRYIENDQLTEYGKSWLSLMGRTAYEKIPQSVIKNAVNIIERFSKNNSLNDMWGVIIFRA